jgi:regulator of cell morphogenesis and NO signaling
MQTFTERTVRDIAIASPETTRVFEEFKIDYCCGGRKPFADACHDAGLDPDIVAEKLATAIIAATAKSAAARESLTPSQLIDHIVAKHHSFTASEIERLTRLMEKVCQRHGKAHPELFQLRTVFTALTASLVPHMQKEEMVLFPYVQELETAINNHAPRPLPHFGTVKNPIRMMMTEHETDGDRLRVMRGITNGYQLPDGACPSFGALYSGLQELERDLHQHIHLENNVLFPAAAALETEE